MQVKICGITSEQDAIAAVDAGADAVGFIFYPKSPRFVKPEKAAEIVKALPEGFPAVGVFVDETYDKIMEVVKACVLKYVQLHGNETPVLAEKISNSGALVIKALFGNKSPSFMAASLYNTHAFLVECPGETLPGGTGKSWDWSMARYLNPGAPMILAGGLNPGNAADAIKAANPDALDVSSGVEKEPGVKDHDKIRSFIDTVRGFRNHELGKGVFI